MTGLMLGILRRCEEERYVFDDEYVEVGKRAIKRLIGLGYTERVYRPNGTEGIRLTPEGRRYLKHRKQYPSKVTFKRGVDMRRRTR